MQPLLGIFMFAGVECTEIPGFRFVNAWHLALRSLSWPDLGCGVSLISLIPSPSLFLFLSPCLIFPYWVQRGSHSYDYLSCKLA